MAEDTEQRLGLRELIVVAWLISAALAASSHPGAPGTPGTPGPPRVLWPSRRADPLALILPEPRMRAAKASSPSQYRLPTGVIPIYYSLAMQPILYDGFRFFGQLNIVVNVLEDTKKVILHAKNLNISENGVTLRIDSLGPDSDPVATAIAIQTDEQHETILIDFNYVLRKDTRYMIYFDEFIGQLNERAIGFYRTSYKVNNEVRWLATTQFEETGARLAFPCFDEPLLKARFDISIVRDVNTTYTSLSNMPLRSSDPEVLPGFIIDRFETTPPASTYTIAFIYADFEHLSNAGNTLTTWARKEIIGGADFAEKDIAPRALQLTAEWTGIPYGLPKMEMAGIPGFDRAMENWGLVTFAESMLVETDQTTTAAKEMIATTICHELGHQWTGNLVTMDWWSHTWLSEAFATFFESFICDKIKPAWKLLDKYLPTNLHPAMNEDVLENQIAMSSEVTTPGEIHTKFDIISYNKGGSVLRMFHYMLTPEVFKAGVRRYLVLNSFKSVTPEPLFRALDTEARRADVLPKGTTFQEIARTWTDQPGVPVLHAERDYESSTVTFRQERFYTQRPGSPGLPGLQRWWIPISWVEDPGPAQDGPAKPRAWLSPQQNSLKLLLNPFDTDAPLLVNPSQAGYYRVNYDQRNWVLLSSRLWALGAATRSQLLSDALALAQAGHLDYATALRFTAILADELQVAPWMTATIPLSFLDDQLATTAVGPKMKIYLKHLTEKPFRAVGIEVKDSDSHDVRLLRYYTTSWACHAGLEDCLSGTATLLKQWLANPAQVIHPDVKAVTLCYGVRGSDSDTFERVKAKWLMEKGSMLRFKYLSALACSANRSLLEGLVRDGLSRPLGLRDKDEVADIFNALINRAENHHLMIDFVRKNFNTIDLFFDSNNSKSISIFGSLLSDIRSRAEFEENRRWIEENLKSFSGYQALQTTLKDLDKNLLKWIDANYQQVSDWIVAQTSPTTPTPVATSSPATSQRPTSAATRPVHSSALLAMLLLYVFCIRV